MSSKSARQMYLGFGKGLTPDEMLNDYESYVEQI